MLASNNGNAEIIKLLKDVGKINIYFGEKK